MVLDVEIEMQNLLSKGSRKSILRNAYSKPPPHAAAQPQPIGRQMFCLM